MCRGMVMAMIVSMVVLMTMWMFMVVIMRMMFMTVVMIVAMVMFNGNNLTGIKVSYSGFSVIGATAGYTHFNKPPSL
jgi:hypothetical protein